MDGEPRREHIQPMTLDELENLHSSVRDEFHNIFRENFDEEKYNKMVHERVEKLVRDLQDMKDRLKYVFSTESGSVYFVLNSGQCFRVKKFTESEGLWIKDSIQPITEKIYFVSKDQGEKAQKINQTGGVWQERKKDVVKELFGGDDSVEYVKEITTGLYPLEINLVCYPSKLEIKERDSKFYITGNLFNDERDESSDRSGNFYGAVHLGHEITNIIKK